MSLPKIDSEESDRKTKHKINFYLVIPFSQVPSGFIRHAYALAKFNGRNAAFVAHDQIECQKPLCQRNMTAMQNCSGCHTDLLVAMTTFIFSIHEQPTVHAFAGWAYKAVWPAFFRKIFVAGFLATELGYERCKS